MAFVNVEFVSLNVIWLLLFINTASTHYSSQVLLTSIYYIIIILCWCCCRYTICGSGVSSRVFLFRRYLFLFTGDGVTAATGLPLCGSLFVSILNIHFNLTSITLLSTHSTVIIQFKCKNCRTNNKTRRKKITQTNQRCLVWGRTHTIVKSKNGSETLNRCEQLNSDQISNIHSNSS